MKSGMKTGVKTRVQIRSGLEPWVYGALVLAVLQCGLFSVLKLRPGFVAIYLWIFGPVVILLLAIGLLVVGLLSSGKRSSGNRPFWSRQRGAAFLLLITIVLISRIAYRVYPSSHDFEVSSVRFRLPLQGVVNVSMGGSTPDVNYHVGFPDQRWAYDLIVRHDGLRHSGQGSALDDYYVYNLPVIAPAWGIVISMVDGEPDKLIGARWSGTPAGNHIVLEVAPNQYLFIGHLKPGSIRVKPGDAVQAGQEIGRVGNSGRTQVPHVHIHLQDNASLGFGEGIPLYFYHYRSAGKIVDRGIPTGGDAEQVVENIP